MNFADVALRAYREIQRGRVGESSKPLELRAGGAFFTENAIVLPHNDVDSQADRDLRHFTISLRDYSASAICDHQGASVDPLIRLGWQPIPNVSLMGQHIDMIPARMPHPSVVKVERVQSPSLLEEWLDTAIGSGWPQYGTRDMIALTRSNLDLTISAVEPRVSATHYWLARIDGRAAGAAAAIFYSRTAVFDLVGVVDSQRSKGVARSLIDARVDAARKLGCSHVVLLPTHEGRGLYKHLGFEVSQPQDLKLLLNGRGQDEFQTYFHEDKN